MASTAAAERAPTREDFAALLDESYGENEALSLIHISEPTRP